MALVLLLILVITEIGFAVFELTRSTTKKNWTTKRLCVNGAEALIYLLMIFTVNGIIQSRNRTSDSYDGKAKKQEQGGDDNYISYYFTGSVKPAIRDSV